MIAFVGSVFSPYYRRAGRTAPEDHCSINVALYGGRKGRWAMTERGQRSLDRSETTLSLGPSALEWDGTSLVATIDERTTPFPRSLRGTIRVETEGLNENAYFIDDNGRHRWRPLSPFSRITVRFSDPALHWSGCGYFDANDGDEPLEDGFRFWDWSRTILDDGRTAILYNTDLMSGTQRSAALLVDRTGDVTDIESPPVVRLPPTPVFRMPRRTRSDFGTPARVVATLEDAPFYSRSVIETSILGCTRTTVHESLSGPRLRHPIVQRMLPYRMPRRA